MALCVFLFSISTNAQSNPNNKPVTQHSFDENLEFKSDERCEKLWNTIWNQAKEGDLQSRALLFKFVEPFDLFSGVKIFLPGQQGDHISQLRDSLILAIHAIEADFEDDTQNEILDRNINHVFHVVLNKNPSPGYQGSHFLECLETNSRSVCAKQAIDAHMVPTFDDFVQEIDNAINEGSKPKCSFWR